MRSGKPSKRDRFLIPLTLPFSTRLLYAQRCWTYTLTSPQVPILSNISTIGNSVPLFQISPKDPKTLLFRQRVDSRGLDSDRKKVDTKQDDDGWIKLRDQIMDAKSTTNLYVYNKGFASDTSFAHMGLYGKDFSSLLTNVYGDVDADAFGRFWSMNTQTASPMPPEQYLCTWTAATSLGNGIVSLVGRLHTSGNDTLAIHIGFHVSAGSKGQGSVEIVWAQNVDDGRSGFIPGEIIHGQFSKDSNDLAMVKYFDSDSARPSAVEAWSIEAAKSKPPHKHAGQAVTTSLK